MSDNHEVTTTNTITTTTTTTAGTQLSRSSTFQTSSTTTTLSSTFSFHPYVNKSQDELDGATNSSSTTPTQLQSCAIPKTVPPRCDDTSWPNTSTFGTFRPFGIPEPFPDSLFKGGRLSSAKEMATFTTSFNGDASLRSMLREPVTEKCALSSVDSPYSSTQKADTVMSGMMFATGTGNVSFAGSKEAPEMASGHDVSEINGGGLTSSCLGLVTQHNVRHADKCLKNYKVKAEQLRHRTESKRKMLGALCVRRSLLMSDVVNATQMVRVSRQRLESQRTANKALMKHIDHLTVLDNGNSKDYSSSSNNSNNGSGAGGVDSNLPGGHTASDSSSSSSNRNNSSYERFCDDSDLRCFEIWPGNDANSLCNDKDNKSCSSHRNNTSYENVCVDSGFRCFDEKVPRGNSLCDKDLCCFDEKMPCGSGLCDNDLRYFDEKMSCANSLWDNGHCYFDEKMSCANSLCDNDHCYFDEKMPFNDGMDTDHSRES